MINNIQLIWNLESNKIDSLLISMESAFKVVSDVNCFKKVNIIFENSWPNISQLNKIKSLCDKYCMKLILSYIEYKNEKDRLIDLFSVISKISDKKTYLIKMDTNLIFYKKELFCNVLKDKKHIYIKNSNFWGINSDFFKAMLQDYKVRDWIEQLNGFLEFDFLNLLKEKGCDNWTKNEDLYSLINEDDKFVWNKYNIYSAISYKNYEKMKTDWEIFVKIKNV